MEPYWTETFYNPSALYWSAHETRSELEAMRKRIASWLGAQPHQLVFTSGATESNNLAVHGVMSTWPKSTILTSAIEHESVLTSSERYPSRRIPVDAKGLVVLDVLDKMIDDSVVLVSIMHANNELGTIQPLAKIGRLLAARRAERKRRGIDRPLLLHSDAAQSGNCLDLHVDRLGVDLMTLSAHKLYGPKGIGGLFVRDRRLITPQHLGGNQEWGLRSGTEALPLIAGFAAALDRAQSRRSQTSKAWAEKKQLLIEALKALPAVALHPSTFAPSLPNIINFSCSGHSGERLVLELDQRGFQVATGSACQAGSGEASHVLLATGVTPQQASSSLRVSFGHPTTKTDLKRFVHALAGCLRAT